MNTIELESTPRSEWLDVSLAIAHEAFDEAAIYHAAYEAAYGADDALTVQKALEMSELFELIMHLDVARTVEIERSMKSVIKLGE